MIAGGSAFVLNIAAMGLVGNTEVDVNGAAVTTSSRSQGNLSVQISAEDIAQIGKVTVSLMNPGPGGGTSALATINIIAGTSLLRMVPLTANARVEPSATGYLRNNSCLRKQQRQQHRRHRSHYRKNHGKPSDAQ